MANAAYVKSDSGVFSSSISIINTEAEREATRARLQALAKAYVPSIVTEIAKRYKLDKITPAGTPISTKYTHGVFDVYQNGENKNYTQTGDYLVLNLGLDLGSSECAIQLNDLEHHAVRQTTVSNNPFWAENSSNIGVNQGGPIYFISRITARWIYNMENGLPYYNFETTVVMTVPYFKRILSGDRRAIKYLNDVVKDKILYYKGQETAFNEYIN